MVKDIKDYSILSANPELTQDFMSVLNFYQAVMAADLFVIDNSNRMLDEEMASQLLTAIYSKRPVILFSPPEFSGVSLSMREVILKCIGKIYICNLGMLDSDDRFGLEESISNTSVNYSLTKHERILVASHLRKKFRTYS